MTDSVITMDVKNYAFTNTDVSFTSLQVFERSVS